MGPLFLGFSMRPVTKKETGDLRPPLAKTLPKRMAAPSLCDVSDS